MQLASDGSISLSEKDKYRWSNIVLLMETLRRALRMVHSHVHVFHKAAESFAIIISSLTDSYDPTEMTKSKF